MKLHLSLFGLCLALCARSADIPKVPVPNSPYLPLVYRFADAMLDRDLKNLFALTNIQQEQNLLRVLYTLSELSAKPKYRQAADAALKSFATELSVQPPNRPFTFTRPWMLWDKCFEVAPEASHKFASSLITRGGIASDGREAGFYLRTWGQAYARTNDNRYLQAANKLLDDLQDKKAASISLAIDADGAARLFPEPLAGRLRSVAEGQDQLLLSVTGRPPQLWPIGSEQPSFAQVGLMFLSRYHNTGKVGYRKRFLQAAEACLGKLPDNERDVWPRTFGQVISLEVAGWKHTASAEYLQHARKVADLAIERFWGTNTIPRGTLKSDTYTSGTGVDTLALALVELHLNILHITAVRCPPNTIDR